MNLKNENQSLPVILIIHYDFVKAHENNSLMRYLSFQNLQAKIQPN
jgi:hypothetical protein